MGVARRTGVGPLSELSMLAMLIIPFLPLDVGLELLATDAGVSRRVEDEVACSGGGPYRLAVAGECECD